MAQDSTAYPFIGSTGDERGGVLNNPAIPSAFYVAPTAPFSDFNVAGSLGMGKLVGKANGVAYAIPIFTNA